MPLDMTFVKTLSFGQFADHGPHYRTLIFYLNDKQKQTALLSKQKLANSGKFSDPIATEITKATSFWKAEEYHQNYYKTNSFHYKRYRYGSGRAKYLKETWGVE